MMKETSENRIVFAAEDDLRLMAVRLTAWYRAVRRDLPWRHTSDPYRIWVSEIMLQQTRVEAVRGYYDRFLRVLPNVRALADCPEDRLLKLWEGLGYYNRVRNMQKAAKTILSDYGGSFPDHAAEIRKLSGIGEYTAGAVASIAFGERVPAVDGNVLRVYARLTGTDRNILGADVKKDAAAACQSLLDAVQDDDCAVSAGDLNQSLIELGALVCLPNTKPLCSECPVRPYCMAYAHGRTEDLPVRIKKNRRKTEELTVLLIRSGERTAVRKRPAKGLLAGMYEFPTVSGHVSEEEAVAYVRKNGYDSLRIQRLPNAGHLFSHIEWKMTAYEIHISDHTSVQNNWIFADVSELTGKHPLPSAFSAYIEMITQEKSERSRTE